MTLVKRTFKLSRSGKIVKRDVLYVESTPAEDGRARTKATVNLDGLHRLSSFHRRAVERAHNLGCFYCCRIHQVPVKEWIDERGDPIDKPKSRKGQTALCPLCGIDAVLPDLTFGFRVTARLLRAMHERWFGVRR